MKIYIASRFSKNIEKIAELARSPRTFSPAVSEPAAPMRWPI